MFSRYQANILKLQTGVFRTNCMDCLDRTNVVQNLFAEKLIERQLLDLGLLSEDAIASAAATAASADKKVNPITTSVLYKLNATFAFTYKGVWADNADHMSLLYSGTGALKTDYTRTGQRSVNSKQPTAVNNQLL